MKRLLAAAGVIGLTGMIACGSDFSPKNEIQTIRILATKADLPYAHPGDTVNLEVLANDGRRKADKKPMRVFWFPAPCINPPGDLYFVCYALVQQLFPLNLDLTPFLVESTKTAITIPTTALDGVVARPGGSPDRSVTAYNFVAACAGHLQRVPLKSGLGLNQLPVGCFDDTTGAQLTEDDDFVFAFTRVFVFDQRRNAIPAFDNITFEGQPIDFAKGVVTGKCKRDKNDQCQTVKFDMGFNDAISEVDPDVTDSNGKQQRETIYVDWFTTNGKFKNDRKIIFDGSLGRPPKSAVEYEPPPDPVKGGTMWAVLHDNRNGTVWQAFPLEIQ